MFVNDSTNMGGESQTRLRYSYQLRDFQHETAKKDDQWFLLIIEFF
ncbi:hypothetical protein BH09BAC4_BH09BAC4_05560 [soil metagenome]